MSRRSGWWMVVAVLFTIVNVAGAVWAAMLSEVPHAGLHAVLTVVGVFWARRLYSSAARSSQADPASLPLTSERIDYLQDSVDAVALEVERLGEAQRFAAKQQQQQQSKE